MPDSLKINIEATNGTAAGWDSVEAEAKSRAGRIGDEVDKSMRGKGFKKAFGSMLRGDFSNAFETLTAKAGGDFDSLKARMITWGAGLATALWAGWNAGKKIDEAFGISDKVAAWWVSGAKAAEDSWDRFYKKLRHAREEADKSFKILTETDAKVFDIREKQKLKGMTPRERYFYAQAGVESAQRAFEAPNLTEEERGLRRVTLEEELAKAEDAFRSYSEEWDKNIKREYEARKEAESAPKGNAAEIEAQFAQMAKEGAVERQQEKLEKLQEAAAADAEAIQKHAEAVRKAEEALARSKEAADKAKLLALSPKARKEASDEERKEKRQASRLLALEREAEKAFARGTRGTAIDRILDEKAKRVKAVEDEAKVAKAKAALEAAQKQSFMDLAEIKENTRTLKKLQAALTLGGAAGEAGE